MADSFSERSLVVAISAEQADDLRHAVADYLAVLDRNEDDPQRFPLFPVGFTREAELLGERDRYTTEDLLDRKLGRVSLLLEQLAGSVDEQVRIPLRDVDAWRHVLREVVRVVDSEIARRLQRELAERMEWGR